MADNWTIAQKIDLSRGVQAPQVWPDALMLLGDSKAHTWRVTLLDGGKAATVTGSVTGYFVRADNTTVPVAGTLISNVASVTLEPDCYAVEGDLWGVMRLKTSTGLLTLAALIFPIRNVLTDQIINPGNIIPSLDELLAQIEQMEKGTAAANAAAGKANTAASNADAKAAAANTAAGKANTAATNADDKAAAADTAAGKANAAATNADAKAAAASTATGNANTAAANANSAAGRVDSSIQTAGEAASAANAAAGAANIAATNADNKAAAANAAAGRANTAAAAIEGITIVATGLPPESAPTATVADKDGHKHIALGIPKGETGDTPVLTFTVKTGAPGTDVQIVQGGTTAAPTIELTIPRGMSGEGSTSSVDGFQPDLNGNVALKAVRYGEAQALTNAEKQQARQNIDALGTGDVADNLTTEDAGKALDARQGKTLADALGGFSFALNVQDGGLDITHA